MISKYTQHSSLTPKASIVEMVDEEFGEYVGLLIEHAMMNDADEVEAQRHWDTLSRGATPGNRSKPHSYI